MVATEVPAFCLIADVMSSRKDGKKNELRYITKELNDKHHTALLTPFSVRSGDELFGIIRDFSKAYYVLKDLLLLSNESDVPLYVGVGIGSVTNEDLNNPHEVNGDAIWSAADALNALKKGKSGVTKSAFVRNKFHVYVKSQSSPMPYEFFNDEIFFLFERLLKRTKKQQEIVRAIETLDDKIQYEELGERFGYDDNVSSNISKILTRADYFLVSGAEQNLCKLLQYFQKQFQTDVRGDR
ncbi:SatD family protein [Cohnella kolymensis]|uniref:SatD family protein n=1 Tax=Cohnella kolymensis TaxID=1590652 RepID=UPI000698A79C|nr:SatD family protein [Cohnella kolymensis]